MPLADHGPWHRGYFAGGLVFGLAVLVVWSAVLFLQVLQAHRIPVKTTQYKSMETFPKSGLVVVSRYCTEGSEPPASPPLFDFASVVSIGFGESDDGEATVRLKRPQQSGVLWRQRRFSSEGHYRFTCAFTVGAFLTQSYTECLSRTFVGSTWVSEKGWKPCTLDDPFAAIIGLNVGNWSTEADAASGAKAHVQAQPSWPAESFFVVPTTEERLQVTLNGVDEAIGAIVEGAGKVDSAIALVIQQGLAWAFPSGVWLFQANNMDPFANIGPLMVTLHASHCEGECDSASQEQSIAATVASASPRWRQPLCDPGVRNANSHQACVPIVIEADMQEAVVISTIAFRWPNMFAQWLSPIIVFVLLFPALVLVPVWMRSSKSETAEHESEVSGLFGGSGSGGGPTKGSALGRSSRIVEDDDDV